jgi:acyl transferase domain-containing protein
VTAAISILNADLWRSWGFRPALALGHSIGEVPAAYVA